jgi:DNA gyrase subunit A
MKIYEIPEASRISKGKNIVNFLNLKNSEKITEILVLSKENIEKSKYLIFATMKGLVKKTELSEYKNLQGRGLKAIRLDEDDLVVGVKLSSGQDDILLCSSAGKSIRFKESETRPLGRVSKGVRGIFLDDQEKVLNLILPQVGCDILTITENGYAKRTDLEEYRVQNRSGKGVYTVKMTEKTGNIVTFIPVLNHFQLLIITNNGQVIKIKNETIRQVGRNTQGVRVINLKPNEKVVSVESVIGVDEE